MESMDGQESNFGDYWKIFRRRRKFFIIPAIIIALLSILLSVLLPSVYSSSATILIEEQVIPSDLVRSTVTTYADQRIQIISQRIMTRSNLTSIIKKYNLYVEDRKKDPMELVLEQMRDRIQVQTISADVVDKRRGTPTQATIAFTLSFNDESPVTAQKVANELVTIFLKENIISRTQSAENATLFLSEASRRLKEKGQKLQEKLAKFKEKNLDLLPEITRLNQQEITTLNSRLLNLDSQERSLQERFFYLQGQLAQIDPNALATNAAGNRVFDIKDRIQILESQYPSLVAMYSANHPDVLNTKREIESLKKQIGENTDLNEMQHVLTDKKAELAMLRRKYSATHPDIRSLEKQVQGLQKKMVEIKTSTISHSSIEPDNPAYITLTSQLESVKTEIKSVDYTRKRMNAEIRKLRERVRKAPLVEKDYVDILQELDNTTLRYRDISAREMEADISQHLEVERKGERFTLIDPPQEPLEAVSPNRLAILLIGIILAIGLGIGTVAGVESMSSALYNEKTIVNILGVAPLASIPYLESKQEHDLVRRNKMIAYSIVAIVFIISLVLFHFVFMPLDVFWYKLLRVIDI
jgi:uncharacterized protein involved in exopolysaccharide biosynthesis